MVVTGPVRNLFGNFESYPVLIQIYGLVLIESKSLVAHLKLPNSTRMMLVEGVGLFKSRQVHSLL